MTTISAAAASSTASAASPLASLSSNFGSFLNLLMTQLKNQNPTSPMDANSFTTELVQFSGVEQQINANTSLTQLIQLTQAADTMQSSAILGKQVTAQSNQLSLQSGTAKLSFTAPAAETVSISIRDSAGTLVSQTSVKASAGANGWTWNGANAAGRTLPDGAYKVSIAEATAGTAVPFSITGTATGVSTANNTVTLQMGALSVPFSAVTTVTN